MFSFFSFVVWSRFLVTSSKRPPNSTSFSCSDASSSDTSSFSFCRLANRAFRTDNRSASSANWLSNSALKARFCASSLDLRSSSFCAFFCSPTIAVKRSIKELRSEDRLSVCSAKSSLSRVKTRKSEIRALRSSVRIFSLACSCWRSLVIVVILSASLIFSRSASANSFLSVRSSLMFAVTLSVRP